MHAKYSSRLTKLFVGMSFFFLMILFALTLTDYLSRGFKTYPGGAAGAGYAPPSGEARCPRSRGERRASGRREALEHLSEQAPGLFTGAHIQRPRSPRLQIQPLRAR